LPFFVNDLLDQRLDGGARRRIARQKHTARPVLARRRQRDAEIARFLPKELVRHLNKDAGAVARIHLATTGAAMQQVD
jgi:hypothetical protein